MEYSQLDKIAAPLLEWYHAGSRQLPWRENKDPYRVWVSEIMLQQTRVETVIPYFERFMERFPTAASLAACDDEELFKLWEGLGYYSRARNLKKAAQMICTRHQGCFPKQYDEILALPGVGVYTAGAISSIAFEKAKAAVDGNVLRVVTRLTQDDRDIMDTKFRREVTEALEKIYPPKMRGDFTQSLMELGAVVCVPNGEPCCRKCPINDLCGAYRSGSQLQYPVKKKKAARRIEEKTVLILRCHGRTAVRKRDKAGMLAGMWELPNISGKLTKQQICEWISERGITAGEIMESLGNSRQLKHIFTHIEWHMTCWTVDCEAWGNDGDLTWVTAGQLEGEIALPTAFKKCLEEKTSQRNLGW